MIGNLAFQRRFELSCYLENSLNAQILTCHVIHNVQAHALIGPFPNEYMCMRLQLLLYIDEVWSDAIGTLFYFVLFVC